MNLITQCCYCKRVKMEVNRWTDHPITLDTSLRNITHGACPECFEAQIKSMTAKGEAKVELRRIP